MGIQARGQDVNASFRKMKVALTAVPVIAVILLSGCTKGSSSSVSSGATYSPLTGVFSDAPVAGLTYKTSSGAAGTTDAQGRFNYASGDSVTFSVGGMLVGTAAPHLTAAGNAPVTPGDLGTSSVSTIGQLLGTLNSIAVARNMAAVRPLSSGVFTMPDNAAVILQPYVNLSIAAAGLSPSDLANIAASGVDSVSSSPLAQAVIKVPSSTTPLPITEVQANLNQAVNASSVIGTVWTGSPSLGGGSPIVTFYFQPDGNMTGFIAGALAGSPGLADGDILAGTWSGSTASATAGVQFSLTSPAGANYSGTIGSGASTATMTGSSSANFTITKVTSTLLSNTLYLGGWYGVYTPTGITDVYGDGTPVYLILSPDGKFTGIMDGNQSTTGTIKGDWTPSSGIGTGSFPNNPGTFSFDMATQTGSFTQNGATLGYISFSRTGILSMNYSLPSATVALVPLTLNVQILWSPNTSSTVVSGFPLELNLYSSSSTIPVNLAASGIKSEINPLGNGAVGYTMTDSISVPYPAGGYATNYVLSAGLSTCTITSGGSGTISDGQPASSYTTVQISCP
jgi:hypothetical protein